MPKPKIIWAPFPGAQVKFLSCPVWECLLHGNRGGGKGLLPTEKILTPWGWTILNKIKVNSVISNPDGTDQTVIAVYKRDKQQMYKMVFEDGTELPCDGDHLWFANSADNANSANENNENNENNETKGTRKFIPLNFYGVHKTEDLYKLLKKYPHKRLVIPCNEPINYRQNWEISVDAYIIGLILDGNISKKDTCIFTGNRQIAKYLERKGASVRGPVGRFSENSCHFSRNSDISEQINKLGLRGTYLHTKFIPDRILRGAIDERTACLQGLMDSGGTVSEDGGCSYSTVSKLLASDFRTLVLSLGGRASIRENCTYKNERSGESGESDGKSYIIHVQFPEDRQLFRFKKKINFQGKNHTPERMVRRIESILKLKKKRRTICIIVDNPNRLFITKDFVVTHNTDVLIMDFLQGVGKGYGAEYKGLLLREATTELGDIISKTRKWIPQIFPTAKYNGSKKIWTFEGGETLWLNYARTEDDYWQYHGHEYPWVGWEELTNHATPSVYLKIMSCNRSANKNIPLRYRATCNPSGPGHAWVKKRFIDVCPPGKIYYDEFGQGRTHVKSTLAENKALLEADPLYKDKLFAMTQNDKMLRDAWVHGSWNLLSGGFFTDVWDPKIHVMEPFDVPISWQLLRSFDWGSSKPWAVTYGFITDGVQPNVEGLAYIPKNSVIIPNEVYGWTGIVNEGDRATSQEIAERVLSIDSALFTEYKIKCRPGPADTQIWEVRDGSSIAGNLSAHGCKWTRAYKGAGSRVAGWALVRQMLGAAKRRDLESPHLYFFTPAQHHIRILPIMQRDKKKPEDINTNLEDHLADSLRYFLARKMTHMKRRKVSM